MTDTSQKRSIELIDAIESILKRKSYPLSLEYLAMKLRKKYTMKSVNKPAFVNMVQCEILKYPQRIIQQESGMFILANPPISNPPPRVETAVTPTPHLGHEDARRNSPSQISGCEEELEVHRLVQEVALLRELTSGCLAWNHSLAGVISERRRELEGLSADTDLLLASYHTTKENGNKTKVKSSKKKYNKRPRKDSRDGKHKRKIIVAKIRKRKLSLKTISVKKSKIKAPTKFRESFRHAPVSPPLISSSPISKPDSQSSAEASASLENSSQSDDSCSVFSTHDNIPSDLPTIQDHLPSDSD